MGSAFKLAGVLFSTSFILSTFMVTGSENEATKLDTIAHDFWEWRAEDIPEFSTITGKSRYNDRVEDLRWEMFEERKNKVQGFMTRLNAVDRNKLEYTEQINYDILKDTLKTFIDGYEWRFYGALNPVNFLEGAFLDPESFVELIPFHTWGDFVNYLSRLDKIPQQLEQTKDRHRLAIQKGHTYNNVSVNAVPKEIDGIAVAKPEFSSFYKPFNETLDNLTTVPQANKDDLRQRAKNSTRTLLSAFDNLKTFIVNDYMPHTRASYGVENWEINGKKNYAACLKWHLSLDMTPEQVHKKGLDEVERISKEMKKYLTVPNHVTQKMVKFTFQGRFISRLAPKIRGEARNKSFLKRGCHQLPGHVIGYSGILSNRSAVVDNKDHVLGLEEKDEWSDLTSQVAIFVAAKLEIMDKMGKKGTIKEFFDELNHNPKFQRTSSDELLEIYREIINNATKKIPQMFNNYPNLPVRVKAMTSDGPGGMYSDGSEDGSRPGTFFANVMRPEEVRVYDMPALTLHETVPGHHLQASYAKKAGLPAFRKYIEFDKYFAVPFNFPFYTAYTEGWALYAESLGEELGLYRDDYELMGRYGSEIFRACRLVVDTGLHHYGWSRERAVEYLLNYTAYSRNSNTVEIDRYITWPGQACAYKIGELKIRELRERAKTELGDQFDLKGFHGVILNNGPMPLTIMENLVLTWITEQRQQHTSTASNTSIVLIEILVWVTCGKAVNHFI